MRCVLAVAGMLVLAACAVTATQPGPAGSAEGRWRQQSHGIPVRAEDGSERVLQGRICRPERDVPARLVVIAHGSPPVAGDRPKVQLPRCESEPARWFLSRGMAVAFALRRGYGATGGPFVEGSQPCTAANYERSARVRPRSASGRKVRDGAALHPAGRRRRRRAVRRGLGDGRARQLAASGGVGAGQHGRRPRRAASRRTAADLSTGEPGRRHRRARPCRSYADALDLHGKRQLLRAAARPGDA